MVAQQGDSIVIRDWKPKWRRGGRGRRLSKIGLVYPVKGCGEVYEEV